MKPHLAVTGRRTYKRSRLDPVELSLFDQVADLVQAMTPEELGEVRTKAHRRGIKVWFGGDKAGREHYEAQVLARHHVDGAGGSALEIGFHSEHRDPDLNQAVVDHLDCQSKKWRRQLGPEAELGVFFGADNWRRASEAWLEPDLDDPDLAFEVGTRVVDYITALEPVLRARPSG